MLATATVLLLPGCTRVIDTARPMPASPVAPITAGQVHELLSPDVQPSDGNLFTTVEPDTCSGVAREVDPPFLADRDPAATDGGHWQVADGREVYIEEMVAVYRAEFDPSEALSHAEGILRDCRDVPFTVTDMQGRTYQFRMSPAPASGSPNILLWSFRAVDWACDSTFVAAHNAAVEISTCGPVGGYDVRALADAALHRIETLANTAA